MSGIRHTPADEPHFLVRSMSVVVPDGRALTAHAHPWGQLLFATSGVVSVWTTEGSWVAPPSWAVWAAPGVAHAIRVSGRATLSTLYMRPSLERLPARSAVVPVSPLLRELAARTVAAGMLDDRNPVHVAMTTLILRQKRGSPGVIGALRPELNRGVRRPATRTFVPPTAPPRRPSR
jgi:hypothetical protein